MRSIKNIKVNEQYRVPPPKSIKEVPKYLKEVVGSFLKRLFYIYKLVWEAKKSMLLAMSFMALIDGVLPVAGAAISAALINTLAGVVTHEVTEFSAVYLLLILQGLYLVVRSVITHSEAIILRLAGELVSNHIKLKIMNRDNPAYMKQVFYFVLINVIRTKKQWFALIKVFIVSAFIVALYGIIQNFFGVSSTESWIDEEMFSDIQLMP